MTLGEKIRQARKRCKLSQEQLADKLCVSRSAIAKWETDKGLPDIENLKQLSRLLNISVDTLLDDSKEIDASVQREPYNIAQYGRGCGKLKKDRFIRERFPNARIYSLLARRERLSTEAVKQPIGCYSPTRFGSYLMTGSRACSKEFYLIETEGTQYLAIVTDEFLELRKPEHPVTGSSFHMGNWHFIRCAYEVE